MNVNLYRNADKILGSTICRIIGLIPKSKKIILFPKKILIIKLWAIGESVLTLPMIEAIHKTYGVSTKITVLARERNKKVYEGLKFVDNIIIFEPSQMHKLIPLFKHFDIAIDCEPYLNISSILGRFLAKKEIGFNHGPRAKLYNQSIEYNDQQHVVKTYLDLAKLLRVNKKYDALVRLCYSKNDAFLVSQILKENNITKKDLLIGMCPSVAESGKNRMWPNQNYACVIDELVEKYGAKIIIVGASNDYENNNDIISLCIHKENIFNFAGKNTLKQLFNLVQRCKLFISNDTGPMHIAAAQGVKTIGIFGPNLPTRFAPYGKKNKSLYVKQYCSPCINVHKGSFPECYNEIKGKCVKEITPEMVQEEIDKCLN